MSAAIRSSSANAGTTLVAAAPANAPGIAPAASQAASLHRIEPRRENSMEPTPPAKK